MIHWAEKIFLMFLFTLLFFFSTLLADVWNVVVTTGTNLVGIMNILPDLGSQGLGGGANMAALVTLPTGAITTGLALTSDGKNALIIDASGSGTVYILDLTTYAIVSSLSLNIPHPFLTTVAITPDQTLAYVVDGQPDGSVYIINISDRTAPVLQGAFTPPLIGDFTALFRAICFETTLYIDNSRVQAPAVYIYTPLPTSSSATPFHILTIPPSPNQSLRNIAISPDGTQLFGGIFDGNEILVYSTTSPYALLNTISNPNLDPRWFTFLDKHCLVTSYGTNTIFDIFPVPPSTTISNVISTAPFFPYGIDSTFNQKLAYCTFLADGPSASSLAVLNPTLGQGTFIQRNVPTIELNPEGSGQIAIAQKTCSNVQGLTGKITSQFTPGGNITFEVSNNTPQTVYVTLALYINISSSLGTPGWVSNQGFPQEVFPPLTIPPSTTNSVSTPGYPASNIPFQLDLYQGSDPVDWTGAPDSGIIPLNLLDAQFYFP